MTDKTDTDSKTDTLASQDSLVDALESIKSLLEKSDAKLAAARESIAIASNQTEKGANNAFKAAAEQLDIPTLDDIVLPVEEINSVNEDIPVLVDEGGSDFSDQPGDTESLVTNSQSQQSHDEAASFEEIESEIDEMHRVVEKKLRDALMKKIVLIETELKKELKQEIKTIKQQLKDRFE